MVSVYTTKRGVVPYAADNWNRHPCTARNICWTKQARNDRSATHVLSDPVILGIYQKGIISNVENGSNTIYTVLLIIVRNLKQPSFPMMGIGFLDKIIMTATECLECDRLYGWASHTSPLNPFHSL